MSPGAVVFSGLAAYDAPGDTTKAFQEPTFIFLNGVEGRHITWTLSGQEGDTAEFEGLHFMEEIKRDPDPRRPFTGTFTLEAGHSMTLRLKPGSNDPVYEYDITITKRGGASFPGEHRDRLRSQPGTGARGDRSEPVRADDCQPRGQRE